MDAQLRLGLTPYYNSVISTPNMRELPTLDGRHAYDFGFVKQDNHYSYGLALFNNYGNLFLNVEALYRTHVSTYALQNVMTGEKSMTEYTETRNVLQIPVAAGLDFGLIRIGTGPTFEYILKETNHLVENSLLTRKQRKVNYGFQFLAGIDLNRHIMINIKYEKDFIKTGDQYYFNNLNTRINSKISRISLGIAFHI